MTHLLLSCKEYFYQRNPGEILNCENGVTKLVQKYAALDFLILQSSGGKSSRLSSGF